MLSPSLSANLPPVLKHYLVLLSLISFIVILSKHFLFFVLIYYIVKFNFFFYLVIKLVVVVVVEVFYVVFFSINEELRSVVNEHFNGKLFSQILDTECVTGKRVSTMCQFNFPHEKKNRRGGGSF